METDGHMLVDSSKFHAPAGHVLCPLIDIDVLVTDDEITPEHQRMVEDAGVRLVVAPIPKVSVSVLPRARAGARRDRPALSFLRAPRTSWSTRPAGC